MDDKKSKSNAADKIQKLLKRNRDKDKRDDDYKNETVMASETAHILVDEIINEKNSFTDPILKMSDEEFDHDVKFYLKKSVDPIFIEMLRRGVAVHHNGMNKRYRKVVENLFRAKKIQIVFSCSTLSLGINMPAKTVVMGADHETLTPTMLKQMSGRAGRRGFDLKGDVIFTNFTRKRLKELFNSEVEKVKGIGIVSSGFLKTIENCSNFVEKIEGKNDFIENIKIFKPEKRNVLGIKNFLENPLNNKKMNFDFNFFKDLFFIQDNIEEEVESSGEEEFDSSSCSEDKVLVNIKLPENLEELERNKLSDLALTQNSDSLHLICMMFSRGLIDFKMKIDEFLNLMAFIFEVRVQFCEKGGSFTNLATDDISENVLDIKEQKYLKFFDSLKDLILTENVKNSEFLVDKISFLSSNTKQFLINNEMFPSLSSLDTKIMKDNFLIRFYKMNVSYVKDVKDVWNSCNNALYVFKLLAKFDKNFDFFCSFWAKKLEEISA